MKQRKVILILVTLVIALTVLFGQSMTYAATSTNTVYVKRAYNRQGKYGYAISYAGVSNNQPIWSLLSMKDLTSDQISDDRSLYCLDITKWLGNIDPNMANLTTAEYNRTYNMDTEKNTITGKYVKLNSTVDGINN